MPPPWEGERSTDAVALRQIVLRDWPGRNAGREVSATHSAADSLRRILS